jgi:hypothetical protein
MQYSELDDYELLAGSLTVWRAKTEWNDEYVDHRPLAPQHERHVTVHPPHQSGDWIGTVFEIHLPYNREALRRALWQWHRRHEAFRTTARPDGSGWQRLLAPPEAIDILPEPEQCLATGAEANERLEQIFSGSIHPRQWPHLVVTTVTPPPMTAEHPRFQVAFAADHSVMDAYSQVLAVTELRELYADALAAVAEEFSTVASYIDFSAQEQGLAATHEDSDTLTRWRHFLGFDEPQFPPFPMQLGCPPDAHPKRQRSVNREFLPIVITDLVHAAAKVHGHGMQTAVLGALAEATRRTSDSRELRFVMPMHTRTKDHLQSMGWFVGLSPVTITLDQDQHATTEHLGALLDRCAAATAHVRDDAAVPFPVIEDRLAVRTTPRFVISFVDIRFIPGADQFDAVRARALRSPASSNDEVYLWVVRARSGMNISARFPDNPVAAEAFETFMETVRDVLVEIGDGTWFGAASSGTADGLAA